MIPRLIATIVYIICDFIYVYISKDVYGNAVSKIQKSPMKPRALSSLIAYLCIAVGWFFLIAPQLEKNPTILNGFLYGLFFSVAVYGTFNFTMNAMFDNWSNRIFYRDLLWGTSFPIIFTLLYTIYLKYGTKK